MKVGLIENGLTIDSLKIKVPENSKLNTVYRIKIGHEEKKIKFANWLNHGTAGFLCIFRFSVFYTYTSSEKMFLDKPKIKNVQNEPLNKKLQANP